MNLPELKTIYGVDFSGARKAGRTIWLARVEPADDAPISNVPTDAHAAHPHPIYNLTDLHPLEDLCGTPDRAPALAYLVEAITQSHNALWAIDFPFGLPVELQQPRARWPAQLDLLRSWDTDDAHGFGLHCLEQARALGGPGHIRRLTDTEAKTPFDTYHYRIIYQTFHGMRDVLAPLRKSKRTAILPFDYNRLPSAHRVIVEACPSSTLKRLGLPHRNYKQTGDGPIDPSRLNVRRQLLRAVATYIRIPRAKRTAILNNKGGDALDAVLAALGALHAWTAADHEAIASHPRYPREGKIYA